MVSRSKGTRASSQPHKLGVATYEAMVACWDAKYTYWLMRPVTADPSIKPAFSTPPLPSYPSGHSTLSSAVAEAS
jgi:membrane-associated phospholipid phosphatase